MDVKYLINAITQMARDYSDKRSDVEDYCFGILKGEPIEQLQKLPEHRYAKWMHNGIDFEYDTLTTLVEWSENGEDWNVIDSGMEYTD